MKSKTLLVVGCGLTLFCAVSHAFFPLMFDWKTTLAGLNSVDRGIMYTFAYCLTLLLFGMGYIAFFRREELISTRLGRTVLITFALFWFFHTRYQLGWCVGSGAKSWD